MLLDILLIVIVTSFIQSIFGVGVLLFGTPLLLLLGYDFIHAVSVLLPISVSINLIQIAKDHRSVDWAFYKKVLICTIPFVVIFLFAVTRFNINIGLFIGLFLLLVAAKSYSRKVDRLIQFLVGYESAYLVAMGIVHGLTNLGGSLLTAIVHGKGYEKQMTRATIALCYATFAIFQILTLLVSDGSVDSRLASASIYLIAGVAVFILTEKVVYRELNNENYANYFALFLSLSGVLLCLKSV